MKRIHPLALLLLCLVSVGLHAQSSWTWNGNFGVDGGTQNVKFGSDYDTAYKQRPTADTNFFGLSGSLLLSPNYEDRYGYYFLIDADMKMGFPLDKGLMAVGGDGLINAKLSHLAIGGGLDVHQYLFPTKDVTYNRPNELLVGVPVTAKLMAGRAYVQGGASFLLDSIASNVQTDSLGNSVVISTADLKLSKSHGSREYKAEAGYLFGGEGGWGLRAAYLQRDVYFDVTSNPTPWKTYYDFHERSFSGGIFFNFGSSPLTGDMVRGTMNTINDKLEQKNAEMKQRNEEQQARLDAKRAEINAGHQPGSTAGSSTAGSTSASTGSPASGASSADGSTQGGENAPERMELKPLLSSSCFPLKFVKNRYETTDIYTNNCGQLVSVTLIFPNGEKHELNGFTPGEEGGLAKSPQEYQAMGGNPRAYVCPDYYIAVGADNKTAKAGNPAVRCRRYAAGIAR